MSRSDGGCRETVKVHGSVNLASILTGGELAGRGHGCCNWGCGWPSGAPNWMATRSTVARRIDRDPCLALDRRRRAGTGTMAEDRRRDCAAVSSPQSDSGEADCSVGSYAACLCVTAATRMSLPFSDSFHA
jgi:hypothetical protein